MQVEKNGVHSNDKDHYSRGCALDLDVNHAGLFAKLGHNILHLAGDVI